MATNDLKALWAQSVSSPRPPRQEIIRSAERIKNNSRIKGLMALAIGIISIPLILILGLSSKPAMMTTPLGLWLIVIGIVFFLLSSGSLLRLVFKPADQTLDSGAYVKLLIELNEKQMVLGRRVLSVYFLLIGAGLLLSMWEHTLKIPLPGRVAVYSATILWILLNWLYIRPKVIRRQQQKIRQVITALEKVEDQIR